MKSIFVNKNSKVRSGWKIASTFASFFVGNIIISLIAMAFLVIFMLSVKKVAVNDLETYINGLTSLNTGFGLFLGFIQCICMILTVWLFWELFDKK